MPERKSKRKPGAPDLNETAFRIFQEATGERPKTDSLPPKPEPSREAVSAAAAALGRLGGLKGGKARAASLSPAKRKAIAKKAAAARWKSSDSTK